MFLLKKSTYFQHAEIYPFFVEKDGEILVRAVYIIDYIIFYINESYLHQLNIYV